MICTWYSLWMFVWSSCDRRSYVIVNDNMYCCALWHKYNVSSYRSLNVAHNNVFRHLLKISGPCSISQLFVTYGIDHFTVLLRKSMYGVMSRVFNSDNILVKTVVNSMYFMYDSDLYKTWVTTLYWSYYLLCTEVIPIFYLLLLLLTINMYIYLPYLYGLL